MIQRTIFFAAVGMTAYALVTAEVPEKSPATPAVTMAEAKRAPVKSGWEDTGNSTVLAKGRGGHFELTARVDGQDTDFLVDTGASVVALTVDEADRLGLRIDPQAFQPITQTASGVGYGAAVRIGSLEVAGQELRNLDAVVIDGLGTNLLGQNALSQLGPIAIEGEKMVIGG